MQEGTETARFSDDTALIAVIPVFFLFFCYSLFAHSSSRADKAVKKGKGRGKKDDSMFVGLEGSR